MMGTFVEITVDDASLDDAAVAQAMTAAFAAAERIASAMSFHDPDSALSRLNAAASGREVIVDAPLYEVLSQARRLFDASHGLFDCTVGADLVARGLLPRHGDGPSPGDATFDDVVLLAGSRVTYRRPLSIDLGGIAKGYAVDRAVAALVAGGVGAAVVDAGGDLRVLGSTAVPIRLRDLAGDRLIEAGSLADGAIATSQSYRVGSRQSPSAIVDPRARRVVDERALCSVIAPTCTIADGLTKVLAIGGLLDPALLRTFDAAQLVH
jgi:thiamine biosynthesis lipoprotein